MLQNEDARKKKEAELLELMRAEGSANRFRATEYTRVDNVKPARPNAIQSTNISSSIDLLKEKLAMLYSAVSELKSRLNPVIRNEPVAEPSTEPYNMPGTASDLQCKIGDLRNTVAAIQYTAEFIINSLDIE